jgi:hypothetical protein
MPEPSDTDTYLWNGPLIDGPSSYGSWDTASDWNDLTAGVDPATEFPDASSTVEIVGPANPFADDNIYDGGSALSISVTNTANLFGAYTTGALTLGTISGPTSAPTFAAGELILGFGPNGQLTAASASLLDGNLTVENAGSSFTVTGVLAVGVPSGANVPIDGTVYTSIGVPAAGTLTIKSGGVVSAGSLEIQDGTLSASGSGASIAVQGAVSLGEIPSGASSPVYLDNNTGSISIGAGATMTVAGGLTADSGSVVSVNGADASLSVAGPVILGTEPKQKAATTLKAASGGTIRLSGLSLEQLSAETGTPQAVDVDVDANSSIEIGSAGGAAAGALTVDAGQTVTNSVDVTVQGAVVNNGIIDDNANLTIDGELSGDGQVQIGADSTLSLNGGNTTNQELAAAAGQTLEFEGPAAVLEIGGYLGYTNNAAVGFPFAVNSPLSGFAAGDAILFDDGYSTAIDVTSLDYTYNAGANSETLELFEGTRELATLNLLGNYSGQTFLIEQTAADGSEITLLPTSSGGSSPVSTGADAYSWIGALSGSWNAAANWQDTTSGADPATSVPGADDAVTIAGSTGPIYEIIYGGGSSASLGVTGSLALIGSYTTGALTLGAVSGSSPAPTFTSGYLSLGAGAQLAAASADLLDGDLTVDGSGASFTASGAVSIGAAVGGELTVEDDAAFSAGSLAIEDGDLFASGTGTSVAVQGAVSLGVIPTIASSADSGTGISIEGGATMSVGGALTQDVSTLQVVGPGSRLSVAGQLIIGDEPDENSVLTYDAFLVSNGGTVQLGGLTIEQLSSLSGTLNPISVSVDRYSSLEIGSAGDAKDGDVTIDAGRTLTSSAYTTLSISVVNNGLIDESAGLLIRGLLSGDGQVQIGAGSTLTLDNPASAGQTLVFEGTGASLAIAAYYAVYPPTTGETETPIAVASTLSGFAAGDTILFNGVAITSEDYNYNASANSGTLTLFDGETAVETLTLLGDYTGQTFLTESTTTSYGASKVILLPASTGGGSPVSTSTDAYSWVGASLGSWSAASNWEDTTTGAIPASYVPGAGDAVSIAGQTGSDEDIIYGGGASASLAVTNAVDLSGTYTTSELTVGALSSSSLPYGASGALTLGAGTQLAVTTANILYGSLSLLGSSASFSASGAVSVGTPSGYGATLTAGSGASFSAQSLAINDGSINVDSGATLTVAAMTADTGSLLTVDGAGSLLSVTGNVIVGSEPVETYPDEIVATNGGAIQLAKLTLEQLSTEAGTPRGALFEVDAKSSIEIGSAGGAATGALTIDASQTITAPVYTQIEGDVVNNGVIAESAGLTLDSNLLSGDGQIQIGAASTLTLYAVGAVNVAAASQTLAFEGTGATLELGPSANNSSVLTSYAVASTLSGFAVGDSILLESATVTAPAEYTYNGNNSGTLTLLDGTTAVETLTLQGNYSGDTFAVAETSDGYAEKITVAACYARGTRLASDQGEIAIENLRIGDRLAVASGGFRPIVWLGKRRLEPSRHPRPEDVQPVRVTTDAFGPGLPQCDLVLSPGHNIAFEGALIPISALINGASVTQERRDVIEYWHVELDTHDVILAEGLPAESYLDCGNRTAFENGGAFLQAHPDFRPRHWAETCLPLVTAGPEIARARAHLNSRLPELGFSPTPDPAPYLVADGRRIAPMRLGPRQFAFILQGECRDIELRSRTFTPACASPESADERCLGLSVARLRIDGADVPLDDPGLGSGWWVCEREEGLLARRWTDGAATLPLAAGRIVIDLAGEGLYWRMANDSAAARLG